MSDIPDSHLAFARALISLAREHSMNHLHVEFDHSGTKNWRDPDRLYSNTKTFFDWEEGRHGAKTRISMVREERIAFEEVEKPADEASQ